jgi:hypothetical protein
MRTPFVEAFTSFSLEVRGNQATFLPPREPQDGPAIDARVKILAGGRLQQRLFPATF